MPIDLNSSLENVSNLAFGNNILNYIFGNLVLVSVIISIISIIILLIILPVKKTTYKIFKSFMYIFFATTLMIFLHNGVNKNKNLELNHKSQGDIVMGGINNDLSRYYSDEYKPIKPFVGGSISEQINELSNVNEVNNVNNVNNVNEVNEVNEVLLGPSVDNFQTEKNLFK